jgi:hypothetical protein
MTNWPAATSLGLRGVITLSKSESRSMTRLWRDQGKGQQAYDLLAPIYGWFAEGLDMLDLIEAKALLNELGS